MSDMTITALRTALIRVPWAGDPPANGIMSQTVRELLKEVGAGSAAVELPTLDKSLQAIQQYRSRG